jgi:hypothetical protein
MKFTTRDKAILIGLYLSKFDKEGLKALGFSGFTEAFNILGLAIGVKPSSLKNYRDEFDPYFPNSRIGWNKRAFRDYCKRFYDDFSYLKFDDFTELIKSLLIQNYEIEEFIGKIEKKDKSESVAKRLITGKSAEEYFKFNYPTIPQFKDYDLKDTTNLACGFDFKLLKNAEFYCVEVKGLSLKKGNIIMTEKEFFVAKELKQNYCLFIVMNFSEKPHHECFFDPLNSRLTFKIIEQTIVQRNYSAII